MCAAHDSGAAQHGGTWNAVQRRLMELRDLENLGLAPDSPAFQQWFESLEELTPPEQQRLFTLLELKASMLRSVHRCFQEMDWREDPERFVSRMKQLWDSDRGKAPPNLN